MKLLRSFFSLGVIVPLPLPAQIANGQVGDATQVMADLNYIAAQVNANAQPLGTTPAILEWQALGQTPTFINTTSFSVPGDFSAFQGGPFGIRFQSTNTAGTIYSTVKSATFGAGVTTFTVANDSGVLDSGLSAVNVSIQGAAHPGAPGKTLVSVGWAHSSEVFSTGSPLVLSVNNGVNASFNDLLGEFVANTGIVTVKRAGIYVISASCQITTSGVTFNGLSTLDVTHSGGGSLTPIGKASFCTGVAGSNTAFASISKVSFLQASDTLVTAVTLTFSAGTPTVNSSGATFSLTGPL